MREIALSMGPDQNLIGIVTEPDGSPQPLGMILLNAGVVHRIGPHRTSVKIARYLARQGFAALRFDISGVGDSRPPHDALPSRQQAVQDIKIAMDYLQSKYGVTRFGLYGICAGAMNGYAAALADERVAGLFMFDGYAFSTRKARRIRLAARWRARSVRQTLEALKARIRRFASAPFKVRTEAESVVPVAPSSHPTKERFAADLQALADRGARVVSLYSGSVFDEYSYAEQMNDAFKGHSFLAQLRCLYQPDVDHLVTPLDAQRQLIAMIGEWAQTALVAGAARS